jgi:hypothetical protein
VVSLLRWETNSGVTGWATATQAVILNFEVNENIQTPVCTFSLSDASTVTAQPQRGQQRGSGHAWSCTYSVMATDSDGTVGFTLQPSDVAGNIVATVATTASGSAKIDNSPPILSSGCQAVVGTTDDNVDFGTTGSGSLVLHDPVFVDAIAITLSATVGGQPLTQSTQFPCSFVHAPVTTSVTWTAVDSLGQAASCTQTVTITDDEPPSLSSCISVQGTTDTGQSYGTENTGSVALMYPSVSDNSQEQIQPIALVNGAAIDRNYPFPYIGPQGTANTQVTFSATDSTGMQTTCVVTVTIIDGEAPVLGSCHNINGGTDMPAHANSDPTTLFGTIAAGSVALNLPTVTDNSGETLQVISTVNGQSVTPTFQFPFPHSVLTYTVTDSAQLSATCTVSVQLCGFGTYAPPAATTCVPCDPGWADIDTNANTPCVSCDAGFYAPGHTAVCEICVNGTADLDMDATTPCTLCSSGFYAAPGSTQCVACADGQADIDSDPATPCVLCTAGSFTTTPSSTVCTDCAAGKFFPFAGQTQDVCQPCQAGYTSAPGQALCNVDYSDDCASYTCGVGGTCTDIGVLSFNCTCAHGYVGGGHDPCMIDYFDDCATDPCGNGALRCDDEGVLSFRCTCGDGYTGGVAAPCSVDYTDDCAGNACGPGHQCTDMGVLTYICGCAPGYEHTSALADLFVSSNADTSCNLEYLQGRYAYDGQVSAKPRWNRPGRNRPFHYIRFTFDPDPGFNWSFDSFFEFESNKAAEYGVDGWRSLVPRVHDPAGCTEVHWGVPSFDHDCCSPIFLGGCATGYDFVLGPTCYGSYIFQTYCYPPRVEGFELAPAAHTCDNTEVPWPMAGGYRGTGLVRDWAMTQMVPHDELRITFRIEFLGAWQEMDSAQLFIDGSFHASINPPNDLGNDLGTCNGSTTLTKDVDMIVGHSNASIQLQFWSSIPSAPLVSLNGVSGISVYEGPGVNDYGYPKSLVNGLTDAMPPFGVANTCNDTVFMTVDLKTIYMLLTIWNNYIAGEVGGRSYCGQKVAVSATGLFSGEELIVGQGTGPGGCWRRLHYADCELESAAGHNISFEITEARYVRIWSSRSTSSTHAHFQEVKILGYATPVADEPRFGIRSIIMDVARATPLAFSNDTANADKYLLVPQLLTWHDALDFCQQQGRSLASAHSAAENAVIKAVVDQGWSTPRNHHPLECTEIHWGNPYPDGDCCAMYRNGGCSDGFEFVRGSSCWGSSHFRTLCYPARHVWIGLHGNGSSPQNQMKWTDGTNIGANASFSRWSRAAEPLPPPVLGQFESGTDGWTESGMHKWTRGTRTPSWATGPTAAATGRYFYFLETSSPSQTGDVSYLISPRLDNGKSMTFYYHMHGSTMGTLSVEAQASGSWHTVWSKTGQQHHTQSEAWNASGTVDLPRGGTHVRFMGMKVFSSFSSDMAVDNIVIKQDTEEQCTLAYAGDVAIHSGTLHVDSVPVVLVKAGDVMPSTGLFCSSGALSCAALGVQGRDVTGGFWSYANCTTAQPSVCGPYIAAAVQAAELQLYERNNVSVTPTAVSSSNGLSPSGAGPDAIVDGDTDTRWLAVKTDGRAADIILYFAVPVVLAQYTWTTAGYLPSRDPRTWLIEASNDGTNWETLDAEHAQDVFYPPGTWTPSGGRHKLQGPWNVTGLRWPDNHLFSIASHRLPRSRRTALAHGRSRPSLFAGRWAVSEGDVIPMKSRYRVFYLGDNLLPPLGSGLWYTSCSDTDEHRSLSTTFQMKRFESIEWNLTVSGGNCAIDYGELLYSDIFLPTFVA